MVCYSYMCKFLIWCMIFTLEHDDNQICWCGLETSMSLHSWKVTYLLLQWWNSTPGSISHIGSQGCLTAIPNMPNNHNHTGKEGLMQCCPVATGSSAWSKPLNRNSTNGNKLPSFPSMHLWAASVQQAAGNPPHSVKERSQGTLQAARWTRLHFSLVCSESAAFNHSLTAAAGSTGSGAMPLSLWAENLSLLYLRNLDPSMQYTHRNSTFRFQKCGVSALMSSLYLSLQPQN